MKVIKIHEETKMIRGLKNAVSNGSRELKKEKEQELKSSGT
jgi:hypothetical protein